MLVIAGLALLLSAAVHQVSCSTQSSTGGIDIVCEDQIMCLACGHNTILEITAASYGGTDSTWCPDPSKHGTNCVGSDITNVIRNRCDGKHSCSVPATDAVFGDPCPGTHNYLQVNYNCVDINECADPSTVCPENSHCFNTYGSYECRCDAGFKSENQPDNGQAPCKDINECNDPSTVCPEHSHCFNTVGSYECLCDAGFTSVSGQGPCTDINECEDPATVCPEHSTCSNTPGSYECLCNAGFTSPSGRAPCTDINECEDPSTVCPDHSSCSNTVGSYVCQCDVGFTSSNGQAPCTDINECEDPATVCPEHSTCSNTPGSYECLCDVGFTSPTGRAPCTDINECEDSSTVCPEHSTCSNTVGSYVCQCNAGFTGSNGQAPCTDINECEDSSTACPEHSTCSNTPGSFVCQCEAGYKMFEGICVPQTPEEWCRYCVGQRNGPNHYEDPLDCSKFYQCTGKGENVQAYHKSCKPCTFWNQDILTCVALGNAKCPSTAPPRTSQPLENSCAGYYACNANGYTIKCCNPGFGFDYSQQRCVDNDCTEDCSVTSSTRSPTTTRVLPSGDTCYYNSWHREAIPWDPYHYWLLWNGQRNKTLSCAPKIFDILTCNCQEPPQPGCLVLHLPLKNNFNDVFNNWVDPGTTELVPFSNGEGAAEFNQQPKSTIEIPSFNNYEWHDKAAVSFWYKNKGPSPVMKGIVTNGDCDNKGSINVQVKGNIVKGGFVTSSLNYTEGFIPCTLTNPASEWHHVVLTYDGSLVSFYVDNVLAGTKATDGYIQRTHAPLTIGYSFCEHAEKFVGFVDDFRVYKCALSAAEVSDLFNNHVLPA